MIEQYLLQINESGTIAKSKNLFTCKQGTRIAALERTSSGFTIMIMIILGLSSPYFFGLVGLSSPELVTVVLISTRDTRSVLWINRCPSMM